MQFAALIAPVAQLAADEQEQLAADLKARSLGSDYPLFTADDPLWNAIGVGQGIGEPIARNHDNYLYGKNG